MEVEMKRRLYYLLPDAPHAISLNDELANMPIPELSVHAVVADKERVSGVPDTHSLSESDRDFFLEWLLWRVNLVIFFVALLVFVGMLAVSSSVYLLIPLAVMATSFILGVIFTLRVPNVHWSEFNHALRHGEVLLMVDVPLRRQLAIERHVHQRHPEAVTGGVCWTA
jgi:hypothetical protein